MDIKKAEKSIQNAFTLLVIMAVFNLIGIIIQFAMGSLTNLIDSVIGVFIASGLAYGVYRKSRVCAIISLVIRTLAFIGGIISKKSVSLIYLLIGAFIIYVLVQGVVGTITYNKLVKKEVNV